MIHYSLITIWLFQDRFNLVGQGRVVNKMTKSILGKARSNFTHQLHKIYKTLVAKGGPEHGPEYARNNPPLDVCKLPQWISVIDGKFTNSEWLVSCWIFNHSYYGFLNFMLCCSLSIIRVHDCLYLHIVENFKQRRSEINSANRKNAKSNHLCGSKSFAVKAHEMVSNLYLLKWCFIFVLLTTNYKHWNVFKSDSSEWKFWLSWIL